MNTSTDGINVRCENPTQRLAIYRAAVQVGFYTDECENDAGFEWSDLNGLELMLQSRSASLFTSRELERLGAYKSAVAFGLYSESGSENISTIE